ncbi:response regulator transcription factor [Ottowia sp.]|uniref:response regulator n=1 Tax=Ottowia sp. TaxID=1898956 RepID=UPI002604A0B4|nr:response regulator transcription factor [Ottowia sp.]
MIHVLLCDDHLIVREGLKQVLAEDANVRVVAEASSAEELLAQVLPLRERGQLDVVLLDIALPGQDGLGALQALRASWPDLPVLILSTYPERQYAVRCIQLGAAGYLHKSTDPDTMLAAVRKVATGERHLSDATAQALAEAFERTKSGRGARPSGAAGVDQLSHREHQVYRLLIQGHSVSEIGAELGLASNTVSTYRARILEKTGARNDVELALLSRRDVPAA